MIALEEREAIVIGAGIAGLSAAIYLARQGVDTLVIGMDLGGQLLLATEIENYPGIPSTDGMSLIRRVESQAREFGASILYDQVVDVGEGEGGSFEVRTASGREFSAEVLVLAFGKTPRELGVPGEEEFKGKGVSYCTICDGPLYRGKRTILVGVGEHAVEAAGLLADVAASVIWVFPGRTPGGDPEVYRSLAGRPNVEVLPNSKVLEIRGGERIGSVVVEGPGGRREIETDGLFVEMGYTARTEFLRGFVDLTERGEVVVDKLCATSRPGVFAAGDVTDLPYKQAVISAGMGATAALSAYNFLLRKRGKEVAVTSDWKHVGAGKGERGPGGGLFLAGPGIRPA